MAGKTGTKTKSKGKTTKKTAAPPPEVDETEEDLELDEVDGDEVEETGTTKKQDEVVFGASDLARYLAEKTGKKVTPRELRTLIRKMARDGKGRVDREITPGNRTRYNWSGPKDPEVKEIIKAFEGGELEADKQAKLAELKANKAKKKAAKDKADKKGSKSKKGKKADVVEDDDDLELDDDE